MAEQPGKKVAHKKKSEKESLVSVEPSEVRVTYDQQNVYETSLTVTNMKDSWVAIKVPSCVSVDQNQRPTLVCSEAELRQAGAPRTTPIADHSATCLADCSAKAKKG